MNSDTPLIVNDWTIYAHPLFLDQLETLIGQVERHKRRDPSGFIKKNATKRLAAIARIVAEHEAGLRAW